LTIQRFTFSVGTTVEMEIVLDVDM